jgi:hypothetical protein
MGASAKPRVYALFKGHVHNGDWTDFLRMIASVEVKTLDVSSPIVISPIIRTIYLLDAKQRKESYEYLASSE